MASKPKSYVYTGHKSDKPWNPTSAVTGHEGTATLNGEPIELSDAELERLQAAGHTFSATDAVASTAESAAADAE